MVACCNSVLGFFTDDMGGRLRRLAALRQDVVTSPKGAILNRCEGQAEALAELAL
jgi:hypothetical protein